MPKKQLERIVDICWPDAYADKTGKDLVLGKTGYWGENKAPQYLSRPGCSSGTFFFQDSHLGSIFLIAAITEPISDE